MSNVFLHFFYGLLCRDQEIANLYRLIIGVASGR
jgi:hypothetical protein